MESNNLINNLYPQKCYPFSHKPVMVYPLISEVPQAIEIYRSWNKKYAWRLVTAGKASGMFEIPGAAGMKGNNIDLIIAKILANPRSTERLFGLAWQNETIH